MKIIRLVAGVLVTMALITIVVEMLEFSIVKSVSGKTMEYLTNNQVEYFSVRNQTWVLVLKPAYTFLTAVLAGWFGAKITQYLQQPFFIIIVVLQSSAFLYASLFSEYKDTLPIFYWLLLLILVLTGVYFGSISEREKSL